MKVSVEARETALDLYARHYWLCCGARCWTGESVTGGVCSACLKWNTEIMEAVYGRND